MSNGKGNLRMAVVRQTASKSDAFIFSDMNGWVKIFRSIQTWEWYKTENMVHIFLHLLLSANHEDGKWQGIEIKRGQLITGRKAISESTGITEQSVRTCIKRLISTNEITIKSTNKYSIITICKYESYQFGTSVNTQQTTSELTIEQPSTNQQLTTNKKDKKERTILSWRSDFKIYLSECKDAYRTFVNNERLMAEQARLNPGINVPLSIEKGFTNFWGTEAGWKHKKKSKSTDINWKLTIINSISMNKVYFTKQELASQ